MKVRIEGIVYNTETARAIESRDNRLSTQDPDYYAETLYRRKDGRFFLYIQGCAFIKGLEHPGKFYVDGGDIWIMSDKRARQWMEDYGKGKLLESLFPEDYEVGNHE